MNEPDLRAKITRLLGSEGCSLDQALQAIQSLGLRADFAHAWLADCQGIRQIGEIVVRWAGSLADKAETVLRLRGEPMTREELSAQIGQDHSVRTLSNYLFADDRFVRIDLHRFGLRGWDLDEYAGIVEGIEEELTRRGGAASLDELVVALSSRYGVSASSVRSYATGPRFSRTSSGLVCLADQAVYRQDTRDIGACRRSYVINGRWSYRVRVNRDWLRGSGSSLPGPIATYVNATPESPVVLKSQFGDVRIGWSHLQPTIGSLRGPLEALGASDGDYLFLIIHGDHISYQLLDVDRLHNDLLPWQRALLLMGQNLVEVEAQARLTAVRALGLPEDSQWDTCRRRLQARGETELAEMLPLGDGKRHGSYNPRTSKHASPGVGRLAVLC